MWRFAADVQRTASRRAAVLAAAFVLAVAAPDGAGAQPGAANMQDLHFLARQVAACYAEGKMAFGQRVLHRRFIESFLEDCAASASDRRAIEAEFSAPGGEACNLPRFHDTKDRLSFERGKDRC